MYKEPNDPCFHSLLISRLRMRRKVLVADSALRNRSLLEGLCSLVGDEGADFAIGCILRSGDEPGNSRDTVLFDWIENLGIGKELGGGEFEYAGPAHSSENESLSSKTSSLKSLHLVAETLTLIAIGALFAVDKLCGLLSECEKGGVLGEGQACLEAGVAQSLNGVGSIPAAD